MYPSIRNAACVIVCLAIAAPAAAQKPAAPASTTLNRIKQTGKIRLGYQADARPFSFRDPSGKPAGYSVDLCLKVADAVKAELGVPTLNIEWDATNANDRFAAVEDVKVDVFCGADTETLARRALVDFSVPVFPGGMARCCAKTRPSISAKS